MHAAPTTLVEVLPRKKRTYWYTFEPSGHFVKPWWGRESSRSDLAHWLSVQQDGAEVARCKFILYPGPELNSFLGDMPDGQLDILALEDAPAAVCRDSTVVDRVVEPHRQVNAYGIGRVLDRLQHEQLPLFELDLRFLSCDEFDVDLVGVILGCRNQAQQVGEVAA